MVGLVSAPDIPAPAIVRHLKPVSWMNTRANHRNHLASTPENIIGRASLADKVHNPDTTVAMKDRNFPLVRFTYIGADEFDQEPFLMGFAET